jgi:hypothetical protein
MLSRMFSRGRRALFVAPAVIVVGLGLAAPFWHKAADHFHYALPGRVPDRVEYKGREFIDPGPCMSSEQIGRRYGRPVSMRRIGTVWGWLTRPRGMYMFAGVKGPIPVSVFVSGGWGDCRHPYVISGSP